MHRSHHAASRGSGRCRAAAAGLAPALVALVAAAAGTAASTAGPGATTARLLFAGDVMLGRSVAATARSDAGHAPAAGPLEGVRLQVAAADLAVANLESPLTARAHRVAAGPNALEAPAAAAAQLARAGFDALGVANNHAGDAGPATVPDTLAALRTARLVGVGGGDSAAAAYAPRIIRAGPLRVALLAFDATGQGPATGPGRAGVARWDEKRARAAVERARGLADIVAVGIHGGAEYVTTPGPGMLRATRLLAAWDVDIVWGSGPHVVQPVVVIDPDGDGRPTVVATSLGNLLFDQHAPATRRGALLEVLAGRDGALAWRLGTTDGSSNAARFTGWSAPAAALAPAPASAAVALGDAWWSLARPVAATAARPARVPASFPGAATATVTGDADGDGRLDLVVSFRRPYRAPPVSNGVPRKALVDALGRSAHIGVYRPADLRQRWVAGLLLRPVEELAACDGSLAVAYSSLRSTVVTGTGAWVWRGFGFRQLTDLPGSGRPACGDVDGDGRQDALILDRRPR